MLVHTCIQAIRMLGHMTLVNVHASHCHGTHIQQHCNLQLSSMVWQTCNIGLFKKWDHFRYAALLMPDSTCRPRSLIQLVRSSVIVEIKFQTPLRSPGCNLGIHIPPLTAKNVCRQYGGMINPTATWMTKNSIFVGILLPHPQQNQLRAGEITVPPHDFE